MVTLLGINIDSDLTLSTHMKTLCKKASQKLNAQSRLCALLPFHRRKMLMNAFFDSLFSYCPLVWMFHSRQINTRINNLHFRALRMVYMDEISSFEELMQKDGSVTIHYQNLQFLSIEMYKVMNGIGPALMKEIFPINSNGFTEYPSSNTRSNVLLFNQANPKKEGSGLQTLRHLGPRIWNIIPLEIRKAETLALFKRKIKKWTPPECPCSLCKTFMPMLGFL